MAGYDARFEAPGWAAPLMRVLLRAAQRRATALRLEMHYRSPTSRTTTWYLSIDGNGNRIAAWAQQLERELPIVAEGFPGPPDNPARRRLFAESLVARLVEYCVGPDNGYDIAIRTSTPDPVQWVWPILWYVDNAELTPRAVMADELLARWIVGDVPEEIVVEELHTIAEALLRESLGAGRRVRWPELLKRSRDGELLAEASTSLLEQLNREYRNRLKHRGEALGEEEREQVRAMLFETIGALDALFDCYRSVAKLQTKPDT